MSHKFSRFFLLIIVSITILFASAGLQAQQSNQQFQGGGPLLAQITGTYLGSETSSNTWYGLQSGGSITTGLQNSFFGYHTGNATRGGDRNSFFGGDSGFSNTTGGFNSYFGSAAGFHSSTGSGNSFFGVSAGFTTTTESNNTFIGASADGTAGITNATAIGFHAKVAQSDSLVLGGIKGINDATGDTKVGIGTTAPQASLHVQNGAIYVGSPSQGVILKSPDGTKCAKLSIDNSGALKTEIEVCPESTPPGKATLISPTGTIQGNTPTYKWDAVWNATYYQLWVSDSFMPSGKIIVWYTAAQVGCFSGTGTCSIKPAIQLSSGNARWWIQTWNPFGYGDWSDAMTFTVP